jgi:L-ornithine N5-oxygenase
LHETHPQAEVFSRAPGKAAPTTTRTRIGSSTRRRWTSSIAPTRKYVNGRSITHRSTNYSAVDPELIDDLYSREYAEPVAGDRRLFVNNASEVVGAQEYPDEVRLTVYHLIDRSRAKLDCDAVVYATGYAPLGVRSFLGDLAGRYEFGSHGRPAVTRDYRLVPKPGAPGDIYLNGAVEHTHGLSSSLLSNVRCAPERSSPHSRRASS